MQMLRWRCPSWLTLQGHRRLARQVAIHKMLVLHAYFNRPMDAIAYLNDLTEVTDTSVVQDSTSETEDIEVVHEFEPDYLVVPQCVLLLSSVCHPLQLIICPPA
jgi:hypothetical protein